MARSAPSEELPDAAREAAVAQPPAAALASAEIAALVEAAVVDDAPAVAAAVLAEATVVEAASAALGARDAGVGGAHGGRGAPPPAITPRATDADAPRVHIGRIDVTVLADAPAPAPGTRGGPGGGDRHFLSRHYLRRP